MTTSVIDSVTDSLRQLTHGRVPEPVEKPSGDEPENMSLLVDALNALTKSYSDAQGFLMALSGGCLDVDPPPKNYLVSHFKHLHSHLKHLTWQTQQVAKGDLNQNVDFLGDFSVAFNAMIQSLREKRLIESALEKSHQDLLAANAKIMESIEYAGSIQSGMIPELQKLNAILDAYFVIFQPRDVIGGDMYWLEGTPEEFSFAVMDCTGHGVSGAFMTIVAATCLKRAEQEKGFRDPGALLKKVNRLMRQTLVRESRSRLYDDGMDMGICYVNRNERLAIYSGAHISLFVFPGNPGVREIKGDNQSLGYRSSNPDYYFNNHVITLEGITDLYMTTDGLIDQIGSDKKLPFGKRRLKRFIQNNYDQSADIRRQALIKDFALHTGVENRRDDVTVFAVSV